MITNNKFICGHIPRTGGDAASQYFQIFKSDLNLDIDKISTHKKHDPFCKRPTNSLELVLTFRKLSCWMLSYVNILPRTGIFPKFKAKDIFSLQKKTKDVSREYYNQTVDVLNKFWQMQWNILSINIPRIIVHLKLGGFKKVEKQKKSLVGVDER